MVPPSDAGSVALKAAGWSVGETAVLSEGRPVRHVSGRNGENALEVRGATQAEAWHQAVEQARSLGMLGLAGWMACR
jgi:hypothetical protein